MKKILIIKSNNKNSNLDIIINQLSDKFTFSIFSSDKNFLQSITTSAKKNYRKSIPEPITFGDYFFFTLALPFLIIFLFCRLFLFRLKKYKILILTSLVEKIIITPWAKIIGYKVVWIESDFLDKNFKINIYSVFYSLFSNFTIIITYSLSVKKHLIKNFHIKEKNISLINQGIDINNIKTQTDIYHNLATKDYQTQNKALFIIGFIGELNSQDGVEYLIKSIEHFKELIPSFQIIIAGDGPSKKNLIWLTKMLGYEKNVRFVGKQENIQRWNNYFDVLVYPRTKEINFSYTVAQCMAVGTPVVSTKIDGISEIVNHQGGILVDPKNSSQLAEAIFQIYNNYKLRMQFANQAKERIDKFYSMSSMIASFTEIIK